MYKRQALGSAPGITIIPEQFGIKVLTLPVGGFLTLGILNIWISPYIAQTNIGFFQERCV